VTQRSGSDDLATERDWRVRAKLAGRSDARRVTTQLRGEGLTVLRRGLRTIWVVAHDEQEARAIAARLPRLGSLRGPAHVQRLGLLDRWPVDQQLIGTYADGVGDGGASSHHGHHGGGHHGGHDGGGHSGGGDGGG